MKINKFTKKKNGMYSITFENNTSLLVHEELILKYDLLITKELSLEKEEQIIKENLTYIGYDLAIKYITTKMRSKKEIEEYLHSNEIEEEKIKEILKKLENNGYIDEQIYAECFINDKLLLSIDGPTKIIKELLSKGITRDIIDEKMTKYSEQIEIERIEKISTKMINKNRNKSNYILKNKILDYLSNLGYEKNLILSVIDNLNFKENKDLAKKEYEKVYKKLSKKYSGKELEYKIKQKMYSLGFNDFFAE